MAGPSSEREVPLHLDFCELTQSGRNLVRHLHPQVIQGSQIRECGGLVAHICAYLTTYEQNPVLFIWRKREVRGTQLRNTAKNLEN